MTTTVATSPCVTPPEAAPSEDDVLRAVALLSEELLTPVEFQALTRMDANGVPHYLADPGRLASVQRTCLQMRNSGAIARLEALRHAREAVTIAAEIMRDSDMHPSTRLNAATFVAKASGTEKPAEEAIEPRGRFTLTIVCGDKEPLVITRDAQPKDLEGE